MPRPATWCWWLKGTGCSRKTPWSVATGERTMPPITQRMKPTMKTAPKIVTRESVLALQWKICAIELCRDCGAELPLRGLTTRPVTGDGAGDHIQNRKWRNPARSARGPFMSRANARDPARDDEGHDAGAVGVEPLHALARHDHEAARHAV